MVILPLIAFVPLIINFNLIPSNRHLIFFFSGLLLGISPTIVYLVKSSIIYGKESIILLFGFAKQQATGSSLFSGLSFYPINIIALSFPLGFLSIIGFIRMLISKDTFIYRSFILFPSSVLIILLFTSSSYSHYSLILYPFIAIYSSYALDLAFYKDNLYQRLLSACTTFSIFFCGLALVLYAKYFYLQYPISVSSFDHSIYNSLFIVGLIYIFISTLILYSNIRFLPYLFFLFTQCQVLLLSNLFALGFLGNPNKDIKMFFNSSSVSNILQNNKILLYHINGKVDTLFRYYIPNTLKTETLPNLYLKRTFVILDSLNNHQIKKLPNKTYKIGNIRHYQLWQVESDKKP